jgi:EmrB/QacA subfamily drug resistance transporter
MVSSGLAALDSSILATAVPSIVKDLGDFGRFPWLFSLYLLAQAVSVPLYAKLADVIGRKPLLLWGIGLFLAASVLCGAAWSMPVLILARGLQGLGAGAILPMTITIAGDIYTVEERAKTQGYLASVWAISSVVGPTLGGIFCQYLTWRWVFWINLPLGLVAALLLIRNFHESVTHREHKIDFAGIGLLTVCLSLLILGILEGGQAWAWDSPLSVGVLGVGGLLLVAFLLVERRAAEPVLPLWIFTRRLLVTTSMTAFGTGAVLLGLTSYIPTYLVRTLGLSPLVAGLSIAAILAGWPLAATFSGRFYLNIGFRRTAVLGLGLVVAALAGLAWVAPTPSLLWVTVLCFVAGAGFGLSATPTMVAAQASVPWNERGVVTGNNQFARAVGSAVGIAVFGAVANAALGSATGGAEVPANLVTATGRVFDVALGFALVTWVAAWAMPADHKKETVNPGGVAKDPADA